MIEAIGVLKSWEEKPGVRCELRSENESVEIYSVDPISEADHEEFLQARGNPLDLPGHFENTSIYLHRFVEGEPDFKTPVPMAVAMIMLGQEP